MSAVTSEQIEDRLINALCRGVHPAAAIGDAKYIVEALLAIGRAQGLREAAGICERRNMGTGCACLGEVSDIITAAAERAERGGGG